MLASVVSVASVASVASVVRSFRLLQRIFFKTTFDNKDLPGLQTALNIADEGHDLANIQAAEKMLTADSYTLHADGIVNTRLWRLSSFMSAAALSILRLEWPRNPSPKKLSAVSMVRNSGSCSFKAGVEAI